MSMCECWHVCCGVHAEFVVVVLSVQLLESGSLTVCGCICQALWPVGRGFLFNLPSHRKS